MKDPTEPTKTLFRDEQGGLSAARTLLFVQLAYIDVMVVLSLAVGFELSAEWWTYQATATMGLIAWAAGPRGLQYLGPQIAGVGRALADATRARLSGTDDRFRDDERGPDA